MSSELHALVKSLSQAERRYFRIMVRRQDRQSPLQYEVLFDILFGMDEYRVDDELAQLKAAGIELRPSLLRAQLKSKVLEAMRSFHSKRDAESELLLGLQDLAFLSDKKQTGLLRKEIRRLRKLAVAHEHYHLLVPIDNYARRLHKDTAKKDVSRGMGEILEEMQEHLDLLTNQLQYTHLLDLMYVFARQDLQLRDDQRGREIKELMTHPLLDSPASARTLTGKMYFHQMHAIFCQLQGQVAEAAGHYAKVVGAWDAAPHFIRERPSIYRRTLGNFLYSCHLTGVYRDFPGTVQKIRLSPARSLADEIEIFDLGYSFEMLAWLGQDMLEVAEQAVPEIEKGLESYRGQLRAEREGYFRYNIAILFFMLEKHAEALRRFRRILEEPYTGQREDLRRAVFLLRLVLLLDSGEWDLLEYELRNTTRYFGQENQARSLSEPVLRYLKARIKAGSEQEGGPPTLVLEAELRKLMDTPKQKDHPALPELLCWALARNQGIPIRQAARRILANTD